MKKMSVCLSIALVALTLGFALLVRAGDMPAIPFPTEPGTVPEVSTEYEVPISIDTSLYLNETRLDMYFKSTAQLKANVRVTWSSSNEKVATVSDGGTVKAVGVGRAEIKAVDSEGRTKICSVRVRYSFKQYIIMIFLFGWLWYDNQFLAR